MFEWGERMEDCSTAEVRVRSPVAVGISIKEIAQKGGSNLSRLPDDLNRIGYRIYLDTFA